MFPDGIIDPYDPSQPLASGALEQYGPLVGIADSCVIPDDGCNPGPVGLTAAPTSGDGSASTTLTWNAPSATTVEIQEGVPAGPLRGAGGSTGSVIDRPAEVRAKRR